MGDQQPDGESPAHSGGPVAPRPVPLFDWAERFVKIGGVLAIFGYISLRVHWNHHGIPSAAWLGVDTYLVEVYGIISTMLLHPLLVFLVVGALCAVGLAVAARRVLGRSAWVRRTEGRLMARAVPWLRSPFGAAALLLLALGFLGWVGTSLVPSFHWSESDLVVGRLDACRLAARNQWAPNVGWPPFWLIGTVTLIGYAAYIRLSPYADSQGSPAVCFGTRCLWRAFAVALLALVLWLPFIYGVAIHRPEYRVVLVHTKPEGDHLLGLLVLGTPTQVELWRAENGIGSMILLPRDQIERMEFGGVWDLRATALAAARAPQTAWPTPEMLRGGAGPRE